MPFFKLVDDKYVAPPARGAPRGTRRGGRREMLKAFREAFDRLRAPRRRPPAVTHSRPTSIPRPREGGARMVAASGRSERGPPSDDGSGGDPPGPPPPPFVPASDHGRLA